MAVVMWAPVGRWALPLDHNTASAVAPMYTALWTLVSSQLGHRIGLPHPALYAKRGRGFNDVTSGDTGGPYRAGRGWDLASGWGRPPRPPSAPASGGRVEGPGGR